MEKKVREKDIENKILEAAITSKDEELDEMRCGTAKESKSDTPETVEEQDNSCYRCEFVGKTKAGLKTHITTTHIRI